MGTQKGAGLRAGRGAGAYGDLFRNRTFVLLWIGQTVSAFGDAFFNLAVVWIVYTQSGSVLQTALVQVVWQLPDILVGPFAGVWADRFDRKRIMVVTNLCAALVVGVVAAGMAAQSTLPLALVLVAIFCLNSLTAFLKPARFAVMPAVVGRNLLATASGAFASTGQVALLLGEAAAGVVVAVLGAVWALAVDALSFVFVALCVLMARLPKHALVVSSTHAHPSFFCELVSGWRAIADQPVVRALVWLGLLINVPSFLGPLYPAFVAERLSGGAAAYGLVNATSVVGGMLGGVFMGGLERRFKAGCLLVLGWGFAGLCTAGIGLSTWLPQSALLTALMVFGITVGGISLGALTQGLIADEYLGRVAGITGSLSVIAIPFSTLLGGWLADRLGVVPLFVFGGLWILGVATLAWTNPHVRTAHL